jgi:hypothetical protein
MPTGGSTTAPEARFEHGPRTLAPAALHSSTGSLELRALDPDNVPSCVPLHVSELDPGAGAEELRVGAEMLRFTPKDHQELLAQALSSGGHSRYAVEIPRRSGKTLTIAAVLLGRCRLRPGHIVRFSAQNGIKTAARFTAIVDAMGEGPDWKIRRAAGSQAILFENGSRFYAHPPKGDAYRGEDTDDAWLDEAQEHDFVTSRELLGAIGPTQDTRPGSTLIISGTTGENREGILWESMERLRAGTAGGVEYAAPETADIADESVWWAAHPGLASGLTTLDKVRERWFDMDAEAFGREYLGIWPTRSTRTLIDAQDWAAGAVPDVAAPADGSVILAWDCDPSGMSAAVYLGWKSDHDDDVVMVKRVRVDEGTVWVATEIDRLTRELKARSVYDPIGTNLDVAAQLVRLRTPRVSKLAGSDLKGGYASVIERVATGRLVHVPSEELDRAVEEAERRPFGESWLWKRTPNSHALVAVTHVAWVAGMSKRRERSRIRTGAA